MKDEIKTDKSGTKLNHDVDRHPSNPAKQIKINVDCLTREFASKLFLGNVEQG